MAISDTTSAVGAQAAQALEPSHSLRTIYAIRDALTRAYASNRESAEAQETVSLLLGRFVAAAEEKLRQPDGSYREFHFPETNGKREGRRDYEELIRVFKAVFGQALPASPNLPRSARKEGEAWDASAMRRLWRNQMNSNSAYMGDWELCHRALGYEGRLLRLSPIAAGLRSQLAAMLGNAFASDDYATFAAHIAAVPEAAKPMSKGR